MKNKFLLIITFLFIFAQMGFAQSKANVSIKFHDREIYYPADKENNPIYIHITIANTGTETFRFKLANDRNFSVDFQTANVKNKRLKQDQYETLQTIPSRYFPAR